MSAEVSLGWNNAQLLAGARDAGNIVDRAAGRMNAALSGIGAGVGFGIFDRAASMLSGSAQALFDATLAADSMQGGMIALTGSVDAANARLEELRQLAKDPGLGFAQVVQGDISLRSVGLSSALATRALREMGNALAVVGKGKADMDGVLLAITQIVSKGKVSAEEINQIAERVPQIRRVMQEAFGTADTEAIQKMGIPVERFIEMVVAGFERTVPRALVRMQGKVDNFTDALTARLADFGGGISEGLIGPLDEATALMESSSVTAKGFGASLGVATAAVLDLGSQVVAIAKASVDGFGQLSADISTAVLDFAGFQRVAKQTADEAVRMRDAELAAARVAADLKRHEEELAEATKRVAEAHAEAGKRARERAKEEAALTAKVIEATNAARDRYMTERNQTEDMYLTNQEKLEKVKERILAIDADLNKVLGQRDGEELAYKLSAEREKAMQELLRLSQAIQQEQERENTTSAKSLDSTARKIADQERALQLYEMELAIAEAQARGQDRKAEQLERERDIIEQTARLMDDMGLGFDEAFRKAERFVDAKARAEDRQNGEGSGGRKIHGYSQSQGDVTTQRTRAQESINRRRADYEDSVGRHFGAFSEMDAAQKDKFSSLFGPAPAETAAAKSDTSGFAELTQSWTEWGSKTLELFEKAMQ